MQANYLESVQKQFHYYKKLGDQVIDRLTEEELHWQYNRLVRWVMNERK